LRQKVSVLALSVTSSIATDSLSVKVAPQLAMQKMPEPSLPDGAGGVGDADLAGAGAAFEGGGVPSCHATRSPPHATTDRTNEERRVVLQSQWVMRDLYAECVPALDIE
jgi:hypothetical protein